MIHDLSILYCVTDVILSNHKFYNLMLFCNLSATGSLVSQLVASNLGISWIFKRKSLLVTQMHGMGFAAFSYHATEGCAVWSLLLLVGSPMEKWSQGRGQTKFKKTPWSKYPAWRNPRGLESSTEGGLVGVRLVAT